MFLWTVTVFVICTASIWVLFTFIIQVDSFDNDSGFIDWYNNVAIDFWSFYYVSAFIIMLICVVAIIFYVRAMEFRLDDKEIIVKIGLVNKTEKHIPFRTITNISSRYGIYDRLFGIGTVQIETAGKSGQQTSPEAKIEGIPIFFEVRDLILERLRKFRSQYATTTETDYSTPSTSWEGSKGYEQELLKELREIKEILSK